MPKEAQFLTSRAARTRHSLDRREGLESQDAEMLGMVLPPHVPRPETRIPPSAAVSPQAAEGVLREELTPSPAPRRVGPRPSLTETS